MTTDRAAGALRLKKLLSELETEGRELTVEEIRTWKDEVKIVLKRTYGETAEEVSRFDAILNTERLQYLVGYDRMLNEEVRRGKHQAGIFLRARIDDLTPSVTPTPSLSQVPANANSSRKVFIIHGHDQGMKETVARFLSRLDLEPVILHEQSDQGRTIIEKFEQHADVAFAVALFSHDDLAVSNAEIKGSSGRSVESLLRPRARQNVVFECGYFIGRLTRSKVVVLHAEGVEMMSDYSGVVYVPFDAADGWRTRLLRELKAVGLEVDANNLF